MEKEVKRNVEFLQSIKEYSASDEFLDLLLFNIGKDNPRQAGLNPDRYRLALPSASEWITNPLVTNEIEFSVGNACKMIMAKSFLQRTDIDLEILARKLDEWITNPWSRDFDVFDYRSLLNQDASFVESLFIVEVIRRYTCGDAQDAADGLSSTGLFAQLRHDLLVHKNSPPFIVLERLFYLAFPDYAACPDRNFLKVCIVFFSESMLIATDRQASAAVNYLQQQRSSGYEIRDLLDFVRKCHAPLFHRQPPSDPMKLTAMQKAAYLEEAGMTLRPGYPDTSVCSIRYREGRLEIPKLRINDQSDHLLMNLILQEYEYYPRNTFICDYLHFMDSLVDTEKDVEVLIHNNILDNFFTDSRAVATLFNKIRREAPLLPHTYYYHGISAAVNTYCSIPRHRWKATLRRDYCSSPWMIASTTAAIIFLVLTLIQTVCSIIFAVQD